MAEGRAASIHQRGEVEWVGVADADRSSVLSCLSLKPRNSLGSAWLMWLVLFILCVEE